MDEYTSYKLMPGDCLKVLKFISCDFFRFKIAKVLLWFHLLVHLSITGLSIYYFLYVMDKKEFIYYAPLFFGFIYAIITMLMLLFKSDLVANIKEEAPMWSIDSAGEKIYKKLKFEIFVINIFFSVLLLLSVADAWLHFETLEHDREFFLAFPIFEHFWPNQKNILWKFYKVTILFCGYSCVAVLLQLIYFGQHARFQVCMFTEKLLTADTLNLTIREEEIYYDQSCQSLIRNRLVFLIRRSQELINLHARKNKQIHLILMLYSICGIVIGTSVLFFMFGGKFYHEYLPRMGILSLIMGMVFVGVMVTAQSLEDNMDAADTLADSEIIGWPNYNLSNKKLYLIFLINILKPRSIKISQNYSVNYELGLAIVNSIYSVITVVINVSK